MIATVEAAAHWVGVGLRESLAMVWLTWWPLVLGFSLAGVVQSAVARETLSRTLGSDNASSLARASLLGTISSSCSYAASAMSRALFARGASWRNSTVFMVASTNLVIELGVVLYVILGWRFLAAQLVGGVIMIALLGLLTRVVFSRSREAELRTRVDSEDPSPPAMPGSRRRRRLRETLVEASRYTTGDLTMIRVELLLGFLVAGFLSAHLPALWWSTFFVSGHGAWTLLENVLLAPLVAALACVCSVGNIPLAATLWGHGVAFGGVVAFLFADLIALPLLAIYRRLYGLATAWRLLALLWVTMTVAGLAVDLIFRLARLTPSSHRVTLLSGRFPLGATLVLNILATLILLIVWRLSRSSTQTSQIATDPVCGMSVETSRAPATITRDSTTFFFCSPRCQERFLSGRDESQGATVYDPVCGMSVRPQRDDVPVERGGVAYYFCSEGCRKIFIDAASSSHQIE